MKALVFSGPHDMALCEHPKPLLIDQTDAIVRMTKTTICGTDLHILKGDVPTVTQGRVLGHEGVGVIEQIGNHVSSFKQGDHVLISCITSCGKCQFCRKQVYSHCEFGGWILGNTIDGTQAQFVRIPFADHSLYHIPEGSDVDALVMLSDILPTGFECGVINGKVGPGKTVAIVGSGPIGLAALLTARLYSPSKIIMIDVDDYRLEVATRFGATHVINSAQQDVVKTVMEITQNQGVDTAIEAVGIATTFELCQSLIAVGGTIANIGVHGAQAPLHLEVLWARNIQITTRLVDTVTTPILLDMVSAKTLTPSQLITHHFDLDHIMDAYDSFGRAAETKALKVIITI